MPDSEDSLIDGASRAKDPTADAWFAISDSRSLAIALPEVSADFRTFTFRIRPGIYFSDDAAFKGQRRELVAEDYVYSIKRHYDPRWKSPNLYVLENAKVAGLSELLRKQLPIFSNEAQRRVAAEL